MEKHVTCLLNLSIKHIGLLSFLNFDLDLIGEKKNLQLNELEEWHLLAYKNVKLYKEWTKRYHDLHIRQARHFKEGNQVLLNHHFELLGK